MFHVSRNGSVLPLLMEKIGVLARPATQQPYGVIKKFLLLPP